MTMRLILWLILSTVGFALSACSPCSSMRDPLEAAALYDERPDGRGGTLYSLPPDEWTRNLAVEDVLRAAVEAGGLSRLSAKHGMQCVPRASVSNCTDCFICRRTVHDRRLSTKAPPACVDYGLTRIEAQVGPGNNISAMTFWQTSSAVPKGHAR